MRPILIHAHRKPITWLKFSKEGDLLFISGKDGIASVWFTETGEPLGSVEQGGAVGSLDVSDDCTRMVTASSDNEAVLWNVKTGMRLITFQQQQPVKFVQFSEGCDRLLVTNEKAYGKPPCIHIYEVPQDAMTVDDYKARGYNRDPLLTIYFDVEDKTNCVLWGPLNKTLLCAMSDGSVRSYDAESGHLLGQVKEHHGSVNKLQFSADKTLFATASSDMSAKLFESKTLELLKTYRGSEPLNTAAISPIRKHVVVGGGTQAQDVTTTLARSSTFDLQFYHQILEEPIGRIKGHFGPINIITFSPDGKVVASGGEDGFVRLFKLDDDYLSLSDRP